VADLPVDFFVSALTLTLRGVSMTSLADGLMRATSSKMK
jgi:hypothetical protein